jgi:hypothetical protein
MNTQTIETEIPRVGPGEPITEPLPYEGTAMQVFAYLNIDNPAVAWASYRGVLISAEAGYQPPQCPISMMFAGMIAGQDSVRFRNEMLIESCRQQLFPARNSRLTGMYFFENVASAQRATNWGAHFSPEYQAELAFHPTSHITRVDSNWITYAPVDENGNMCDESWMPAYWSGAAHPDHEPLWELIGQGRAIVYGTDLRVRAYNKVYEEFPTALSPLEFGRIAAHLGSDLATLSPWLIRNDDGTLNLTFYMNLADAENPEFLEKLGQYKGPKNHRDLAVGGEYFRVPQFKEYKVEFKATDGFLHSVHSSSTPV